MKKIIFGILLGFLLHKGLSAYHSYLWWSAEATTQCRAEYDFDKMLQCIHKDMGLIHQIVPYLIMIPVYRLQKWELFY